MIRTPLRPLARILEARAKGENPDAIEHQNRRLRHEQMRDQDRNRAEGRLLVLGVCFFCAFAVVGARMGLLAVSDPVEPRAHAPGSIIANTRADIVDRNGRILATNLDTHALYAETKHIIDAEGAARKLVKIFPDLKEARLIKDFTGKRKFLWVKKKISPEQMQAVHDIGDPGLLFAPRDMRLYPNGKLAAHIMGGSSFGREGVRAAEVIGVAGAEKYFNDYLSDPANAGKPLELSLDLSVQAATERVLEGGMKMMNAKGATSILMDVHTGEVISVASLPSFDPNKRPRSAVEGDPTDSPLFNRSVQGVYELGSTFKIFAAAQAMELGLVNANTMIDTKGPMKVGGHTIGEYANKNYGTISVSQIIEKSSNRGTGRLALMIGKERQQEFLRSLGLFEKSSFEIIEASGSTPLVPARYTDLSAVTVSYGHGISTTAMHLAAGYAAIANGGLVVKPTLLKQSKPQHGARVMRPEVAAAARRMLRDVVSGDDGTASFADVPGYSVAGKTGTSEKLRPGGGYYKDKNINTFAAMFPAENPRYVLIVTLDEPVMTSGDKPRRTAGWTSVPVAAEMIRRVAPLLGMRPTIEPSGVTGITLTSSN